MFDKIKNTLTNKANEVTTKGANKYTLINVVNWRKYQALLNENRQENRQENSQENRQPIKNIKNILKLIINN